MEPALSRRAIVLAGEFLALVLAFFLQSLVLIIVAEVLVTILIMSLALITWQAKRITVSRSLPPRATEGEEVEARITVHNPTPFPLFMVAVEDLFPPADGVKRPAVLIERVPARGRASAAYRAAATRGRGVYEVGPARVTVADPLGLFPCDVPAPARSQLLVHPRPVELPRINLLSARGGFFVSAEAASALAGHSACFFGAREYRPGDSIRHLHAISSARRGNLVVKEFEQASATEVTILLDLERHAQRGGSGKRSSLESAVKIAASLARHALAGGHAVQIAGRSREWLALPSRTGESQLHLILDHLARVEARGPLPFHEAVAQAASLVGAAGTVFFIFPSPNFDTAAFAALFALFRSRGTRMIAVVLEQPPISGQPGAGEDAPPRLPRECADCFLLSGVSYTVFSRRTPWENLFDNLVTAA